ncbi:hypothetical protein RI367_003016 [Sorochytrium milnesiophthora]
MLRLAISQQTRFACRARCSVAWTVRARTATTSASDVAKQQQHSDAWRCIYEAPLARSVRLMKLFSVSSLGATVGLAPLVFTIDVSDMISDAVKAVMMGTAITFSLSSTALIHWCLKSYVTKMSVPASLSSGTAEADIIQDTPLRLETLSVIGKPAYTIVPTLQALRAQHGPFVSWRLRDDYPHMGLRRFFLHVDGLRNGTFGEEAAQVADIVELQSNDTSPVPASPPSGKP